MPIRFKDKFNNESTTGRTLGERATQIKSPVISDGITEEWETASESSDFVGRADDYQNAQNFHSKAPDREFVFYLKNFIFFLGKKKIY